MYTPSAINKNGRALSAISRKRLDNSEGSIQLATTFNDPSLQNVTIRALLTNGQKILPLSEPIEANLGLGEIRSGAISSGLK